MNLELDEEERGFISRSLQVLADSSELIANIRDLQNIESGRDRPEPLDVCSMLKEITDAYRSPMDRKVSISLTTHGGCMVHASMLLRGAFSNLISNAIKHSTGAVDIHITVIDYYHYGEKMVRIDVSDNGPGIADERKGVIFDGRSAEGWGYIWSSVWSRTMVARCGLKIAYPATIHKGRGSWCFCLLRCEVGAP
jgi:signal transduction histidine kinase